MMLRELQRFFADEGGTEVIEWAVVALVLLAFTVGAIILVGQQLNTVLCNMLVSLGGAQCATPE
jgi:Flp pilus assembly pilin Flp